MPNIRRYCHGSPWEPTPRTSSPTRKKCLAWLPEPLPRTYPGLLISNLLQGIMWDALYNMDVPSPYIPKTSGEGDDSNFDRYDEERILWAGENFTDPYEEIFKGF